MKHHLRNLLRQIDTHGGKQYREKPLTNIDKVRDELVRRNEHTSGDWYRSQELVRGYKET